MEIIVENVKIKICKIQITFINVNVRLIIISVSLIIQFDLYLIFIVNKCNEYHETCKKCTGPDKNECT